MGGGKSQKGGKHGSIGRTLAHDILLRQSQKNEELKKNMMKKKEYSVYERSNLEEFTMAATQGLESYVARRGATREVTGNDFNSQLYEFIHFPQVDDDSNFPVIPIPRRTFFFTEDQKQRISMLNRQKQAEAKNAAKKYFRRKNKKKVDMYMHGDLSRPYHGYYNKLHRGGSLAKSASHEASGEAGDDADADPEDEDDEDMWEDEETASEATPEETSSAESDSREGVDRHYYVNKYLNYLREESSNLDLSEFSREELEKIEMKNFYMWRSLLSEVEAREKSVVTPYEKNIDFWRHLWRVIERSNLILIILDSRDPLFFRIADLENYIKEIDETKDVSLRDTQFVLVLNKADFLSRELRKKWVDYFRARVGDDTTQNIDHVFFSSLYNNPNHANSQGGASERPPDPEEDEDDECRIYNVEMLIRKINEYKQGRHAHAPGDARAPAGGKKHNYTVGFVGYPNVGKSSLINCLMESTRACVGVQPGKTKHIQTLYLSNSDIVLCDCPGLIFPTLVRTKYHLLINNIVSTAHFKWVALTRRGNMTLAVQLICNLIPAELCKKYDLNRAECTITTAANGTERKILFSLKVLEALCENRKFKSAGKGGQLDLTRACKLIINDFTQGTLLYCKQPPGAEGAGDPPEPELEAALAKLAVAAPAPGASAAKYIGKTEAEHLRDEENVNQWLKQQLNEVGADNAQKNNARMTKRKMRFLIKGKRRTS